MSRPLLTTEAQAIHERQRAVRALLMNPMLRAGGGNQEEFGWIRIHAEWLREWFGKHLAWPLHVDSQIARLGKTPAEPVDHTRPARDPEQGNAFTRSRYVFFCLALACLERSERQTTLGKLADDIRALIAEDPVLESRGIALDLSLRECRKNLVDVIRLLIDLGVIARVQGDESQYLAEKGDVLYAVHRPAISWMLNIRRGPSSIDADSLDERISLLLEEPMPHTEEGWNRYLRVRLLRKLTDDPVLYYRELESDEKAYLDSQRHSLLKSLEEGTGLVGEIRAEGIAMVDEQGTLTDIGMPCEGTEGHFTLLMAERLAQRLRGQPAGEVSIGTAELEAHARELIARFGRYWRGSARDPGAEKTLLPEALSRLEALRLIQIMEPGTVLPLPALARYSVESPTVPEEEQP